MPKKTAPKPKKKPVTPKEGKTIQRGNRVAKMEAEAAKKLKGYKKGGKVKKGKTKK